MSGEQKLHELVERLPTSELETAVELLEGLVEAPVAQGETQHDVGGG